MTDMESGTWGMTFLASGKGWLVVDKPAGMTVHNDPGRDVCSLVLAHIQREAGGLDRIGLDPDFGVNPVHRLDKETSGVLLLAATPALFRFFSKQFEARQVEKRYAAVLHGRLEKPQGSDAWETWRWPLSKTAGGRNQPQGGHPRLAATTRYRILDISERYTMVEIDLLSGRKHQIRRHAKLSGHPVVGDARYGSKRAVDYLKKNCGFDRLGLHARSITFQVPDRSAPKTVATPAIPAAMLTLMGDG